MDRARESFEQAGARLFLIGQATPRHAAHFRRSQGIDAPVLADERRESYKAAGAKKAGASELIGPKVVAKGALATMRTRKLQTRPIGDTAQLGGTLVIRPGGDVAYAHMAQDASDNTEPERILEAVRGALA